VPIENPNNLGRVADREEEFDKKAGAGGAVSAMVPEDGMIGDGWKSVIGMMDRSKQTRQTGTFFLASLEGGRLRRD
jgi:hypothetical protein